MNRTLELIEDKVLTRENAWNLFALTAVVIGAAAAKTAMEKGWRLTTGEDPPLSTAVEDTSWREAVVWGVVTGAIVGLASMLSHRGAALAWKRWA